MSKILKNRKGFTLIELLVVVAVIGILASVILVGVAAFRGKGRDARRIQDLRQIQNGLELYFTKNGSYPAAIADLLTAVVGVNQVPTDPSTNAAYGYCVNGSRYVVGANLEEDNNEAKVLTNKPCDPSGVTCGPTKGYCVTI